MQRFFHVHLLKTAGMELYFRLRKQFGEHEIYPNITDGRFDREAPQVSLNHLRRRWADRKDEIRVIVGHYPYCSIEMLDAPFTTLTVLREPVERTLSYLRHHRENSPPDRDRSLEDIYDDPVRFKRMIENHMVKMLGLDRDEMTIDMFTETEFRPDHLERAKQNLALIDVVGVQEHFSDFCEELERRFGWNLGEPLHANRSEPEHVAQEFRARIAADNALDIELYEYAREIVAARSQKVD